MAIDKQDTEIITDLITTVVDEEATATLLMAIFLCSCMQWKPMKVLLCLDLFDEDFEEIEEEKPLQKPALFLL